LGYYKQVDDFIYRQKRAKGLLSERDKDRRLEFALKHVHGYVYNTPDGRKHTLSWNRVVFSDASVFPNQIEFHRKESRGTWDTKGEHAPATAYVQHAAYKAVVYGILSSEGCGAALVPVTGTTQLKSRYINKRTHKPHVGMCSDEYVNDVLPQLIEQTRAAMNDGTGRPFLFMHDADNKHKRGETYLQQAGVQFITDWGAKLTELNPIENVWSMLRAAYIKRLDECKTPDTLMSVLQEEWAHIDDEGHASNAHASVPKRLREVIRKGGGRIDY
jgi:hypothetical protein